MLIDFLILILADRLALARHFLLCYIQRTLVSPPGVVVGWLTMVMGYLLGVCTPPMHRDW